MQFEHRRHAPTTSAWLTTWLPIKMHLILETILETVIVHIKLYINHGTMEKDKYNCLVRSMFFVVVGNTSFWIDLEIELPR